MNKIKQYILNRFFKLEVNKIEELEDKVFDLELELKQKEVNISKLKDKLEVDKVNYRECKYDKIIWVSYTFEDYTHLNISEEERKEYMLKMLLGTLSKNLEDSLVVFKEEDKRGTKYTAALRVGHVIKRNQPLI